jgi:hypothetical protein
MFLRQHAVLVRERLAVTSGRVQTKFEWLARYHNAVVEEILTEFDDGRRSASAFEAEYGRAPVSLLRAMIVEG